ncbi:MAG: transglutaminase-like putative cysteine protease [Alteromonadaceae bacterium]|jgi:transglutaminase-like putative cysteine protease
MNSDNNFIKRLFTRKKVTSRTDNKPSFVPDKNILFLLLAAQVLNFISLVQELAWWMLAIILLCLIWHTSILLKKVTKPSKILINLLSLCGCILLIITAKQLGLLATMVHLLCFAYVLKLFEIRQRNDFYQIVLLSLFVAASSLIFSQTLYFTFYVAVLVMVNLMVVFWHFSPSETLISTAKYTTKLLLQSLPLAIFLFIVFPKLAPLWQVPFAQSAKSGLSDSVSIGDIANLALSDELAFRIKFAGQAPRYSKLYWRTIVLDNYDGRTWQRSKPSTSHRSKSTSPKNNSPKDNETDESTSLKISAKGTALNYQVIASPSQQHWLYALGVADVDRSEQNGDGIIIKKDHTLYNKKRLTKTLNYHVFSYLDSPLSLTLSEEQKRDNLQYPPSANPQLVAKAQALKQLYVNDIDLIQAVLENFNQALYHYTLRPPLLFNNSLDQFYFDTKAGFCEHYASAFTFLMRAAGIPARMVTGYMGAEYNPNANYYSVYQRDAHAWSEVWLEGRGWLKVDPTAMINPERIERGFSSELLQELSLYSDNYFSLMRYKQFTWINEIRLQLQAIDYQWTRWVIGYSAQKQVDLLAKLVALLSWWKVIVGLLILLVAVFFLLRSRHKNKKIDKQYELHQQYYHQVLALFAKNDINKPNILTAEQFSIYVSDKLPSISDVFTEFTTLYVALNYQKLTVHETLKKINKMEILLLKLKSHSLKSS